MTSYSFTAFTEADLLQGVNGSAIGCGDTFEMPASATVCIDVWDNDATLSGDSWCNENANDGWGQNATITGAPGNGRQIYAEQYHVLKGSDGKIYYLIEIEQEGSHQNFFTFYGAQPPAGVSLTVTGTGNVTSNWVKYDHLGAGEKDVPGSVGGRLFVDADHDDTEWNAETGSWEAGVDGATVTLIDKDGHVVATTTTDHSGTYKFDGVAAGEYRIEFTRPDGTEFVKKDVGHHGADSDVDAHGVTDLFTIGSGQHLWNIDAGVKEPATGTVSGTVFCDTNCDGINGTIESVPGKTYVLEAEDMCDWGFKTVHGAHASGGELVKLHCDWGVLWTDFKGETGSYDLTLHVQDESDGNSLIKLFVDGHYIEAVRLDENGDGAGSDNGGFSTYVIEDVAIETSERIKLLAWGDGGEFVRIDKIELQGESTETRIEEPVKEGVTVKLLDTDGHVVATTTTEADGSYAFADVPVGDYRIMGVAPDGTEFTIKDVDGNGKDGIDSDVGADGKSDLFTVIEDTVTDLDLGLCDKGNTPPVAVDDDGKTCVTDEICIDVTDNDSDADGDTLAVTAVNGHAIAEGGTVVIDGVTVSLVDGELCFDGSAATGLVALNVGDSEIRVYDYTVSDGTDAATASVEVEFCGAAETIEELDESLPAAITFTVTDEYFDGEPTDAYTVTLASDDKRFDGLTIDAAYCIDFDLAVDSGVPQTGTISALDTAVLTGTGANGQPAADNLDLINWILNEDYTGQGFTDAEVQAAIWELVDDLNNATLNLVLGGGDWGDIADVNQIVAEAVANGEGFTPGQGDIVGLILDPDTNSGPGAQPFIVGLQFDAVDCLC